MMKMIMYLKQKKLIDFKIFKKIKKKNLSRNNKMKKIKILIFKF
jgi:hypothetical protein